MTAKHKGAERMNKAYDTLTGIAKATLLAAALLASPLAAAQDYPTRQVTLVVPFSPGGANDTVGRFLAERLAKLWKQPVVVENRPGAGSAIGTAHVTKSKPDGYTLLFVSGSLTTNAAIQKSLPFDPLKDLQPIAMAAIGDLIVLTGTRTPMASLKDMQAGAKSKTLFYGTPGVGTLAHMGAELLNDVQGIQMKPVHYPGGTEAITDMGGGRIDVYACAVNDAKKGVGKPIAVMSEKRSASFPDIPTTVELGYPEAVANIWLGVFGPAKLPKDVSDKINHDIVEVMKSPDAAKFLDAQGSTPSEMSVDDFTTYVANELKKWSDLAQKHGIAAK
jgi:tripartite-type tricarboxylate transporter receptor subunit TctC